MEAFVVVLVLVTKHWLLTPGPVAPRDSCKRSKRSKRSRDRSDEVQNRNKHFSLVLMMSCESP